jgi:uncharacterized repeat protein (TIGR01451 family)
MEKSASRYTRRIKLFAALGGFSLTIIFWIIWLPASVQGGESPLDGQIKINELDSDTPGTDTSEFIELFDGGIGGISLTGYVLVFYNGATDTTYRAVDLDGYSTNRGGYFLVGNKAVPGVNVTFPDNFLQNGADAIALYLGNRVDFPNGTPITTDNLIDAVVYGTSDPEDTGLLNLLNPQQNQVDENLHSLSALESIQRCPNGSGLVKDTNTYITTSPTPGLPNCLPIYAQGATLVQPGGIFTYTITVNNYLGKDLSNVIITDPLPAFTTLEAVFDGGVFSNGLVSWEIPALADQGQVQVRFRVYASGIAGIEIENRDYAVQASNFVTPTFGIPFITAVEGDRTLISSIQGQGHISSFNGLEVERVFGIVTALRDNGFFLEDPVPDVENTTSEGIYVDSGGTPNVSIGDALFVKGKVLEVRPGGIDSSDLTITELVSPTVLVLSSGNQLPDPIIIGNHGRKPPGEVIENDALGDVETGGIFDPASDGIDFYESLEGMLVQIQNPVAVGPTDAEGRIPVIPDEGINSALRTPRGGIVVRENDFNPERIIIDDVFISDEPKVTVGSVFSGTLDGVMDYAAGNFRFLNVSPFPVPTGGVISETLSLARSVDQITVASMNLENLDPADPQVKFDRIANEIIFNLNGPDLIAVEEVQDDSGTVSDGTVTASLTFNKMIQTILQLGGIQYEYRQIDPLNNRDGGDPGGNIRQAFLFRTDRGLNFVDRPGGTSTASVGIILGPDGPQLSFSPGRIDPLNSAFFDSRKPLAGEFLFDGQRLFVIANHFNSKIEDDPLFGRFQPPYLSTEGKRVQQAQIVNNFMNSILQLDPNAFIIVLGDLNDYTFSTILATLTAGGFKNLVNDLPAEEQYTYLFDGNSQAIDHILVSRGLSVFGLPVVDIVHMNAEFLDNQRPTDHDPIVARISFSPQHGIFLPFVRR